MNNESFAGRGDLRLASSLLLTGQFGYIAVTRFHAGGNANHHYEIFETYAHNQIWGLVHTGQFGSMAILLVGLLTLASAFNSETRAARWLTRICTGVTVATLALYGALQAVDGVALKQSVSAWAAAPDAEKAARFAAAESIRWLEWGIRSYQDFAFGLALVFLAGAVHLSPRLPQPIALVIGLCGLTYVVQGWIAGAEGFSPAQSIWIVAGWALGIVWMAWLAYVSWTLSETKGPHA